MTLLFIVILFLLYLHITEDRQREQSGETGFRGGGFPYYFDYSPQSMVLTKTVIIIAGDFARLRARTVLL